MTKVIPIIFLLLSFSLIADDKIEDPSVTIKRWLSYFENGTVDKYVAEALLPEKMKEMKITAEEMTKKCTTNKDFFIQTLNASLDSKTASILIEGDNQVAVFYWKKPLFGFVALSLYLNNKKWIACKMYNAETPATSKDRP